MAELTQSPAPGPSGLGDLWKKISKVWLITALLPLLVAIFDPGQFWSTLTFAGNALMGTAPFIVFAVLAVGYMKATGAENLLAKAFEGNPARMVLFAAMLGGLSPFCSCEVIPFIAALLAVGAPLAAVMAFWLASPLMDPAMFMITWGEIGLGFTIAKTLFAIGIGLFGGFVTMWLAKSAVFADPLKEKPQVGGCCGVKKPFSGTPVWKFWHDAERRGVFGDTVKENFFFLFKWLTLAYMVEALMVAYIPAETISTLLGGQGIWTTISGALVGMPAYLNGYAAAGLIGGLLEQGMAPGAAMSFMLAGGVSSIPAAMAVWALVKPRVFAAYLGLAFTGAVLAGVSWGIIA